MDYALKRIAALADTEVLGGSSPALLRLAIEAIKAGRKDTAIAEQLLALARLIDELGSWDRQSLIKAAEALFERA